jgi:hypothetical protein
VWARRAHSQCPKAWARHRGGTPACSPPSRSAQETVAGMCSRARRSIARATCFRARQRHSWRGAARCRAGGRSSRIASDESRGTRSAALDKHRATKRMVDHAEIAWACRRRAQRHASARACARAWMDASLRGRERKGTIRSMASLELDLVPSDFERALACAASTRPARLQRISEYTSS